MTAAITTAQIGAIHAIAKRAGMDEDTYRAFLERETGQRSCKGLSRGQAFTVIERLKGLSTPSHKGGERPVKRAKVDGAMDLNGPFAGVCRALWLSAWNLGLVRDRTDRALVAFVRRQTGIDHLNWVKDPMDARPVIEALKSWTAREAGVEWDLPAAELERLGINIARWRKIAVVIAQARILGEDAAAYDRVASDDDLDRLAVTLGKRIRARQEPS